MGQLEQRDGRSSMNVLLVPAVTTCETASKKYSFVSVEILTSMTMLAAMTAMKAMMFITRMPLRMM